jgi:hypothetical protein
MRGRGSSLCTSDRLAAWPAIVPSGPQCVGCCPRIFGRDLQHFLSEPFCFPSACSQFCTVAILTPIIRANSLCDFPRHCRIDRMSSGSTTVNRDALIVPRLILPACRPFCCDPFCSTLFFVGRQCRKWQRLAQGEASELPVSTDSHRARELTSPLW